jgi:hypothetical protein
VVPPGWLAGCRGGRSDEDDGARRAPPQYCHAYVRAVMGQHTSAVHPMTMAAHGCGGGWWWLVVAGGVAAVLLATLLPVPGLPQLSGDTAIPQQLDYARPTAAFSFVTSWLAGIAGCQTDRWSAARGGCVGGEVKTVRPLGALPPLAARNHCHQNAAHWGVHPRCVGLAGGLCGAGSLCLASRV